jgi:hypothetical protein
VKCFKDKHKQEENGYEPLRESDETDDSSFEKSVELIDAFIEDDNFSDKTSSFVT